MRYVVLPGLTEVDRQRWQQQFVAPGRDYLRSIWRRSQDVVKDPGDPFGNRRRIIHVHDKYEMVPGEVEGRYDLCITECYLWLCSTLPTDESLRYVDRLVDALRRGGWKSEGEGKYSRGELTFRIKVHADHPEDLKEGRRYGFDYSTVECTMRSVGFPEERIEPELPWAVFKSGARTPGTRVPDPTVVEDLVQLLQHFPVQVELGGGASLELGIPPLNYFHTVYGVYAKTPDGERFAYGDTDVLLDRLLVDPEAFYVTEASVPYVRAMQAQPSDFYRLLRELADAGLLVGPIITNNFDGLPSLVGLGEMFVRRYDEAHIVPEIDFHPDARGLLVVGAHADRRRIQEAAKRRGLKVIYVDPEQYVDHDGNLIAYPLEKIESDDLLVRTPANEFARRLRLTLAASS